LFTIFQLSNTVFAFFGLSTIGSSLTAAVSLLYSVFDFYFVILTLWELVYDIFVLRFRPKKQQFSVALPAP